MTKPRIQAIETVYNGYRFRSRLEARYAVLFDSLGIEYRYEVEGYDLDGLWYLPDFYIPIWDTFIEIKGSIREMLGSGDLSEVKETILKPMRLSRGLNKKVLIFIGDISPDGVSTYAYLPKVTPEAIRVPGLLSRFGFSSCWGKSFFCKTEDGVKFLALMCHSFLDKGVYLYFPLERIPAYPEAFYRDILNFSPVTLDKSTPPNLVLNDSSIPVFAAYNSLSLDGQKLFIMKDAYLAARQARFEHKNGKNSPNVL